MITTCIQLKKWICLLPGSNVTGDHFFPFVIRECNNLTYDTMMSPSIKALRQQYAIKRIQSHYIIMDKDGPVCIMPELAIGQLEVN